MAEAAQQAEAADDIGAGGEKGDDDSPSVKKRRKGHGRRPLPANLPRHRIEHPIDPEQMTCPCCGEKRRRRVHKGVQTPRGYSLAHEKGSQTLELTSLTEWSRAGSTKKAVDSS